jgi:hypothetical protein
MEIVLVDVGLTRCQVDDDAGDDGQQREQGRV